MTRLRFNLDALTEALGPIQLPGEELKELAAGLTQPLPVAIRINSLGPGCPSELLGFAAEPVSWDARTFLVHRGVRPAGKPVFATGAFFIQDAGSTLAVRLLGVRPGERVLDLCASPGGKATAILEELGDAAGGALMVNEAIQSRLPPLRLNLARHGGWRYVVTARDPDSLADHLGATFDAVLVDAPCTGQSLLARGRQTTAALTARQIAHSAARQRRILAAGARLVRPGGRMVYSTCTFSWAENEQQIVEFLREHPDFSLEPSDDLASWQGPAPAPPGCYRLWPHRHPSRGAFAARLRRREDARPSAGRRPKPRATRPPALALDEWGDWPASPRLIGLGEHVCVVHEDIPSAWLALADSGPQVAQRRANTWSPAYGSAMRRDGAFRPRQCLGLDEAGVRRYLSGQQVAGTVRGWTVVCIHGLPIGWAKGNGQVLSNHLPKSARLVCDTIAGRA